MFLGFKKMKQKESQKKKIRLKKYKKRKKNQNKLKKRLKRWNLGKTGEGSLLTVSLAQNAKKP